MDTESYEQIALNSDAVGDALKFVKENEMCKICSHNGSVYSVEPPLFVLEKDWISASEPASALLFPHIQDAVDGLQIPRKPQAVYLPGA